MKLPEQSVLHNWVRRSAWAVVSLLLLLACQSGRAATTTYTWNLPNGAGNYDVAGNWNPATVPNGTSSSADVGNGGTVSYGSGMTYSLQSLLLGEASGSGTFNMSGGELNITNTGNSLVLGNAANSTGTFTMDGGTLNLVRSDAGKTFFQDFLQIGSGSGAVGAFVLNSGTVTCLGGIELGSGGHGTLTINGGTFIDNGWLGVGRGGGTSIGSGTVNVTGGTFYQLRNPGTDSQNVNGVAFCQGATNGVVNISGTAAFYTPGFKFINAGAPTRYETLNIWGGTVYIGYMGVSTNNNGGTHVISANLSGGTIGSVNLSPNTGGTQLLSSVLTGGTNWTWSGVPINLTNSPGSGTVTFAPETSRTFTLNSPISGPGALVVNGDGTVAFGAANTYTGGTTLSKGNLQFNSGGSVADVTLTVPSGSTIVLSGAASFTNNTTGAGALLVTANTTATGTLGHSGVTVVNAGILTLGAALNNSSAVLVTNTGSLAGLGPINGPVTVTSTVGSGSAHLRMGTSPLNIPGTLTINNHLTLGAGSELDVKLGTANTTGGGLNDLLVVNGDLTIESGAVLNLMPIQPLTPGTYVIATYTGTCTGTFDTVSGGLSRYGFSVDYSNQKITVTVSGSHADLVWTGIANNVAASLWNVQGSANWFDGTTATSFYEGDAVTFDDSASNCTVQLATTLYPASITFNNTLSNYSVTGTGTGRITGGTGITKNGSGTVTMASGLNGGNDYTGPVAINNGILKMNGTQSLGATNGATTVAAGATLDLNGNGPQGEPLVLAGAGLGGTNGAINNTGGQLNFNNGPRRITLTGDTTFNASNNRWDVGLNTLGAGDGYFHGNGYALTKIGSKDLWMHEVGDTGLGDIFIKEGLLGFEFTIGLGDPSKTVFVSPNATLGFWQVPGVLYKNVSLTNAKFYSFSPAGSTTNTLNGTITLAGTNTFDCSGTPCDLLGSIGGAGGLQKIGAGALYLDAPNTYTGPTLLTAGSIVLRGAGTIANSSLINLAAGTTLDASPTASGLVLGAGQTLAGAGTVAGAVTAGNGATIAPGNSIAGAATLTLSTSLTLNGGSTNSIKLSANPNTIGEGVNDLVQIGGDLVLNGTCYLEIVPIGTLDGNAAYTVMQYNGALGGSGSLVAFCRNPRYTVSVDTSYGSVRVSISGSSSPLVWQGDVAGSQGVWDHTATNWLNSDTGLRDKFFNGDVATFDDTGKASQVFVSDTETAGTIAMSNNAVNYTFIGGLLTAGTLDLEGSQALTLAMTNAPVFSTINANRGTLVFNLQGISIYTNNAVITDDGSGLGAIIQGGTNTLILGQDSQDMTATILVTNGILQYTNANNLGQTRNIYPLLVTNTGTLDMVNVYPGPKRIHIAGSGFNGQGALIASKGLSSDNGPVSLTLDGDAAIGAPGTVRWDFHSNMGKNPQIKGNGHKLTKVGTGTIIIYDQTYGDTDLGDIDIVQGRLAFQLVHGYTIPLGNSAKSLTVRSNATLTFYDVTNGVMDKVLVMHGSEGDITHGMACFDSAGSSNTFWGPVTLIGTNNLFGLRSDLLLSNSLSGTGGFVVGTGPVGGNNRTLYLYGANTYTGPTVISNNYSVVVGSGSSLGSSSRIQVSPGAKLDVSALSALTLGAGQTLMGSGTGMGNFVFGNGATLAAGFPNTSTYTLTLNGKLTFQSGSTNLVVVKKGATMANDTVAGLDSVVLGGTLVLNNVGNALADGDAIRLFTATNGCTVGFDNIIPATPGPGLLWDTSMLLSDGILRVVRNGPPSTPTNLVYSVSGNQLTLSWPSDYTGWTLQAQTNAPGVGLTTQWQDVPGSAATNRVDLPVDPANGSVFYRMVLH